MQTVSVRAHINVRSRLCVRRFVCDRVRKYLRARPHVHSVSVKILQSYNSKSIKKILKSSLKTHHTNSFGMM